MDNNTVKQSFNVDDIRRIRTEASIRYEGKTFEEVSREISKGAQIGYQIIEKIRREKRERQSG